MDRLKGWLMEASESAEKRVCVELVNSTKGVEKGVVVVLSKRASIRLQCVDRPQRSELV
jgi:hypothetical protein